MPLVFVCFQLFTATLVPSTISSSWIFVSYRWFLVLFPKDAPLFVRFWFVTMRSLVVNVILRVLRFLGSFSFPSLPLSFVRSFSPPSTLLPSMPLFVLFCRLPGTVPVDYFFPTPLPLDYLFPFRFYYRFV